MLEIRGTIRYLQVTFLVLCALTVAFVFTMDESFAATPFKKTKVGGVKAKLTADRTVTVSWKKMRAANGYVVYYSLKKKGKFRKCATSKASSVKVKKLAVGKTYYFKVRPFKKSKKGRIYGKYSKYATATIAPVSTTVTPRAAFETTDKINVKFYKRKGASGYEIWRGTVGSNKKVKYTRITTLGASKNSFVNTGLKTNTRYYYKVRPFIKVKGKKVYGMFGGAKSEITGGNSLTYALSNIRYTDEEGRILKGKRLLFLGSSVTYGSATGGVSFVDYLKKKDGINVVSKEAVRGTTLSFVKENNYCERLENCKPTSMPELLVCQLSSNDSRSAYVRKGKVDVDDLTDVEDMDAGYDPVGGEETSAGEDPVVAGFSDDVEDPDAEGPDRTQFTPEQVLEELRTEASTPDEDGKYYVESALKYIIAYSNLEFNRPVMFYVLPKFLPGDTFNAEFYSDMRDCLLELSDTWAHDNAYGMDFSVYVLDMWEDEYGLFSAFEKYDQKRGFYMADSVHPTKAGYYEKYVPAFEEFLINSVEWK